MSMTDRPIETDWEDLLGGGEMLLTNEFSGTADLDITRTVGSLSPAVPGEIQSIMLHDPQAALNDCWLFFFDIDPATVPGDAALALAERQAIIGQVRFVPADFDADANGITAYKTVAIPFHAVDTLYAVYRDLTIDTAGWIRLKIWYRRDD